MKITTFDNSTVRSVFWGHYLSGVLFSFIAFFSTAAVTFSYKNKNRAKWLGSFAGLICSFPLYGIICSVVFFNWIVLIISSCIAPLAIVFTIYIYTKNVYSLILEEKRDKILYLLPILEQSRRNGKIGNAEVIYFLEEARRLDAITNEEFIVYKEFIEMESKGPI